jgi:hypothetical protein
MVFNIPDNLPRELYPLSWLLGEWKGGGLIEYVSEKNPIKPTEFEQTITFTHDTNATYLTYDNVISSGDDIWSHETGFWMLSQKGIDEAKNKNNSKFEIEVVTSNAAGWVTLFVGVIGNARIDIASDAMARTPHSFEVSGIKRMYGLVDQKLLWAEDIIAFGEPLKSYASGTLNKVESDKS